MRKKSATETLPDEFSRRDLLSVTGIAVAGGLVQACAEPKSGQTAPGQAAQRAPFDSLRDYVQALDNRGLLMRAGRIDQDAYEGTALMYRLVDRYGRMRAPAVMFDEVRIDGRWIPGPVLANHERNIDVEAILFGLEPVPGDGPATYRLARKHLEELLASGGGAYPKIEPRLVSRDQAPCKQVVVTGNDIDVGRFPFFRNNPGDSGRFINTATVITSDPEMGINLGTYRCELKGPRLISVGSGEGQTGYRMLMAARARGESEVPIALVLGQDPMIWLVSGARIPEPRGNKPVEELATAGGLRGRAVDIIAADTSELPVPAHAEMVIEGTISFDEFLPNGPYCESPGYLGAVYPQGFKMTVTRITHRRDPWFINDFTGITRPLIEAPGAALTVAGLRKFVPQLVDYRWQDSVTFISIRKTEPGQALAIGKRLIRLIPIFKIVIMVDEDVDLMNPQDLYLAFSTRWQPHPASEIFEDLPANPLEPSSPVRERSSKIVIDATRQWPEEGGPEEFPAYSRALLEQESPEIFSVIDSKWGAMMRDWSG